MPKNWP